jgi:hypothetical protein
VSVDVPFAVTHWSTVMASLRTTLAASDESYLVQSLDDAQAAWEGGRHSDAIRSILNISRAFDIQWRTYGGYASELAVNVGRLLRGMQREWYMALMQCQTVRESMLTAQDWRPVDREDPLAVAAFGGTPAWLLGFVNSTVPVYNYAALEWTPGDEYEWQMIVNSDGEAQISFTDETGKVVRYVPEPPSSIDYRPFVYRDNVELRIEAFPSAGLASVNAKITSINGDPVTMPMLAAADGQLAPPASAAYFRVPTGSTTLDIVGRFTASYLSASGPLPTPPVQEMLRVRTFTSNVCRRPGA